MSSNFDVNGWRPTPEVVLQMARTCLERDGSFTAMAFTPVEGEDATPELVQQTWTNESLNKLYAEFNKAYFGGQLPDFTVLLGDPDPDPRAWFMGESSVGLCEVKPKRLLIAVQYLKDDFEVTTTLLHEMAHITTVDEGHGAAWKEEIERLWQAGAPMHRVGWSTQGELKDDPKYWDEDDPRFSLEHMPYASDPDEFAAGIRASEVPEMRAGEMLTGLEYVPHILESRKGEPCRIELPGA
jgi:hypothetical protein